MDRRPRRRGIGTAGRSRTRSAARPSGDGPGAARTPAPRPRPEAATARSAAAATRRAARRSRPPRTGPATSKPTASTRRTGPRPRSPATRPAPPSPPGNGARPATPDPDHPIPPMPPRPEMISAGRRDVKHLLRTKCQACREPLHDRFPCSLRFARQRRSPAPPQRPRCKYAADLPRSLPVTGFTAPGEFPAKTGARRSRPRSTRFEPVQR